MFYALKPISGIVALGKIESEVFENHQDIWGKGRYPFRVKIELMPGFTRKENNPIPLGSFLGKIDSERGIRIEPYLRNVWVTHISHQQYRRLKGLFHTANES